MTQLTQQNIDELNALLTSGNRTGMYLRYYELTASHEAIVQAQISSFSGSYGAIANTSNQMIQWIDHLTHNDNYPAAGGEGFLCDG